MTAAPDPPSGVVLLDKRPGLTSFASLAAVKRALRTGKVGHTGTLDKFASGLLVALVGRAGRLAPWFLTCDKDYEAVIRFGEETDTLDPEGTVVAAAPLPSRDAVEAALAGFRGAILQVPPVYSAVHVNGRRASALARSGEPPALTARPVTVYGLELRSWDPPLAGLWVRCSSGTYVRSLARDIALAAGSRARLDALRRTRIGGFGVAGASPPESPALRPVDAAVIDALGVPRVAVDDAEARAVAHGAPPHTLPLAARLPAAPAAALFHGDVFLAALARREGRWGYGCGAGGAGGLGAGAS